MYKFISLFLFSFVILYSAPKAFDSLGNELEAFQQDCKKYTKSTLIPSKIKSLCRKYILKIDKDFKFGYKLDLYIANDNADQKKLDKYLKLLRQNDEKRNFIKNLINKAKVKALDGNNSKLYNQLMQSSQVRGSNSDNNDLQKRINYQEKLNLANSKDSSSSKISKTNPIYSTSYNSNKNSSSKKYICSELSKSQAVSLFEQGHKYLDKDSDGDPCEPYERSTSSTSSTSRQTGHKKSCHWVKEYRRKNGTLVKGHERCR